MLRIFASISNSILRLLSAPHDSDLAIFTSMRYGANAVGAQERVFDPIDEMRGLGLLLTRAFVGPYRRRRHARSSSFAWHDRYSSRLAGILQMHP